jgi:PD-(D/E)XK endonuclease
MASLKTKGDLAELQVAADLVERGYRIAIPFGEDIDFDLILIRGRHLERVQVKYTESNGDFVVVRARSLSLTKWEGQASQALHRRNRRLDRGLRQDNRSLLLHARERAGVRQEYVPSPAH